MSDETKVEGKHDETIPGGKYVMGDNYVNANGEVIGKVKGKNESKSELPSQAELTKMNKDQLTAAAQAEGVSFEADATNKVIADAILANRK